MILVYNSKDEGGMVEGEGGGPFFLDYLKMKDIITGIACDFLFQLILI